MKKLLRLTCLGIAVASLCFLAFAGTAAAEPKRVVVNAQTQLITTAQRALGKRLVCLQRKALWPGYLRSSQSGKTIWLSFRKLIAKKPWTARKRKAFWSRLKRTCQQAKPEPTVPPSADGLAPIARWDMVPFQRIDQGQSLNLAVVAFSQKAIDRVEFKISGQGYTGAVKVSRQMTLNTQSNVWEYWVPLAAAEFKSDGVISIEALVVGKDGGVRDKTTGGGGLGLDPLTFTVNPTGSLPRPQVWVAASGGSDSYGSEAVGNPDKKFATVQRAFAVMQSWMNSNGHGNKVDGGVVNLEAGTHIIDTSFGPLTEQEWVTIKAAPGLSETEVVLQSSTDKQEVTRSKLLKLQGFTLKSSVPMANGWVFNPGGSESASFMLWMDKCLVLGSGMHIGGTNPIGQNYVTKYFTDTSFRDLEDAITGAVLARGVHIQDIGNDAFDMTPLIINSSADNLDPAYPNSRISGADYINSADPGGNFVVKKPGAFKDYDFIPGNQFWIGEPSECRKWAVISAKLDDDRIQLTEAACGGADKAAVVLGDIIPGSMNAAARNWHADAMQWWGYTSQGCKLSDNLIVYGYRATNLHYQGMFLSDCTDCAPSSGMALVNNYVELVEPIRYGGGGSWFNRKVEHLIFWHNSFVNRDFWMKCAWATHFSMKGNLFYGYDENGWGCSVDLDHSDASENYYQYKEGSDRRWPGAIESASGQAPGLDSYGRPAADSPLKGQVSSRLVPADADGSPRGEVSDIGAYQAASR